MSLSSLDHDALLQDKIRLDSEIRCMTDSLMRLQQENDKLSNKNMASAEGIVAREAAIVEELERNELELETLMQERGLMQDTFAHEQLAVETEVQRYQHAIERYHELLQENEQLRKTTLEVLEETAEIVRSNEKELHGINKQQLQFRLQLEEELRKKLVDVERKQQDESFAALPARAKEMLFDNAKLKDEISLQAVGIRSIDMRAARETMEMRQIHKRITRLKSQGDELRAQITGAAAVKLTNQQRIAELKAAREDLQYKEELLGLHSTGEDIKFIIAERIQEYSSILNERSNEIAMWSRRISALNQMAKRLRITRAYSSASRSRSAMSAKPFFVPAVGSADSLLGDSQTVNTAASAASSANSGRAASKELSIHADFSRDRELSPIVRSVRRFSMTAAELGSQPKSQLVSTVQEVLDVWEQTQLPERVHKQVPSTSTGVLGEFLQRYKSLKSVRSSVDRSFKNRTCTAHAKAQSAAPQPTDWKLRLKRSLASTSSISLSSSISSELTQHPLLASPTSLGSFSPERTVPLDRAVVPTVVATRKQRSGSLPKPRKGKHLIKGQARVRPVAHLIAAIERA